MSRTVNGVSRYNARLKLGSCLINHAVGAILRRVALSEYRQRKAPHSQTASIWHKSSMTSEPSSPSMSTSASPILSALQRTQQHPVSQQTTPTVQRYSLEPPLTPELTPSPQTDEFPTCNRRVQRVLTNSQRSMIVKWMLYTVETEGDKHIASKAVTNFPHLFRGTLNSNLIRASRLWKSRETYTNSEGAVVFRGNSSTLSRVTRNGLKRVHCKAREGRGRKRVAWVLELHQDLVEEFDRLR